MAEAQRRAAPGVPRGSVTREPAAVSQERSSRDWHVLVLNGEAGLTALCQVVREAWARGETTWRFDGLLTARQQEPLAGEAPGVARGQGSWELPLPLPAGAVPQHEGSDAPPA